MSTRFGAMTAQPPFQRPFASLLVAGALLAWAMPAMALYKVVGPDGSVTYTDRPPVSPTSRVSTLGPGGVAPVLPTTPEAALPFELRQATSRFPVTLYTSADCAPCDSARQLLQQRGVPFTERRVANEDDAVALERAVGGRTVPALMVGTQALRGLSQSDWTAYLDAAGYPRESRLPRGYQPPPATPLVERTTPTARAPAPAPVATPPSPPPAAEVADPSAIRF
jgi:glutaredoxin